MMSPKRRTALTIFVIGIMILIHSINLVKVNSYGSESTSATHSSGPVHKEELAPGLTRGDNSTVEDFEDNIDGVTWSTYSSDINNCTNGRSNYNAYNGSSYSWRMDSTGTQPNLNELILHVGLVDVDLLYLSFATREYGSNNQDAMPNEFIAHTNGDGIAVSNDGITWYTLWQYPANVPEWAMVESMDISLLCPNLEMDPKEDFYLKFQQYGRGNIPNDGILWDHITLLVNGSGQTIPEIIMNVPEPEIEANITNSVIYADGQSDNGTESADVSITVTGKGEGSELSGESLEIKYDIAGGLWITDYGNPDINGDRYTWTKNELVPDEVWEVSFTLHAFYSFNESIGPISYRYDSWDGDQVGWNELDEIHLKVRGVDAVEIEVDDGLGEDRIISGKQNGSLLTANAYDQDGIMMPAQDYNWQLDPAYGVYLDNINKNIARIIADEGTSGSTGEILLTHIATSMEFSIDYQITCGRPAKIEVNLIEPYIVGEQGVIAVAICDDFGNWVEDYNGTVTLSI